MVDLEIKNLLRAINRAVQMLVEWHPSKARCETEQKGMA